MREPPGVPRTRNRRPAVSRTMDGVMAESIRFPGAIAFASPCTRPNRLGLPGAVLKSSISSFNKNPAPVTVTALPKSLLRVVVHETVQPGFHTGAGLSPLAIAAIVPLDTPRDAAEAELF